MIRILLLLTFCLLLTGCGGGETSSANPEAATVTRRQIGSLLLELRISTATVTKGNPIHITATLRNVGVTPVTLTASTQSGFLSVSIRKNGVLVKSFPEVGLTVLDTRTFAPTQTFEATFDWNSTNTQGAYEISALMEVIDIDRVSVTAEQRTQMKTLPLAATVN